MNTIDNLLATQEFATLPNVTLKVLDVLESSDDVGIRELSKVVETDASLTLKLIRVANSPLFAVRGEISSLQQAIVTLGLNRVTNIVLGISIFSQFMYSTHEGIKEVMEKYWWHTSTTAIVCKSLAKKLNLFFKEQEFIGGLLHDVGKLAMLQHDFEIYKKIIDLVENENKTDMQAEMEVFEFDHAQVSAGIARLWKLPKDLSMILEYHNNVLNAPVESQPIVAVVNMANMLCAVWGADFYEGIKSIEFASTPEWKILTNAAKIKDIDFEEITFGLEKDYQDSQTFLNIMSSTSNL